MLQHDVLHLVSLFPLLWSVKQNAVDLAFECPMAARAVDESFYVDDGADFVQEAIQLQVQLQNLFFRGAFLLCKWNSNGPATL